MKDSVQFGRWLLKHATPIFNEEGLLTWSYDGKHIDTLELYKVYKQRPRRFQGIRDYFKRLKHHSGWSMALVFTLLGAMAGAGNKSFDSIGWWWGALFGATFLGLFCVTIILFSNEKD